MIAIAQMPYRDVKKAIARLEKLAIAEKQVYPKAVSAIKYVYYTGSGPVCVLETTDKQMVSWLSGFFAAF